MPEDKKEKEKEIAVVQVPTQMGLAFQVPGNEQPISMEEYLVWMGNILIQLNKKL